MFSPLASQEQSPETTPEGPTPRDSDKQAGLGLTCVGASAMHTLFSTSYWSTEMFGHKLMHSPLTYLVICIAGHARLAMLLSAQGG